MKLKALAVLVGLLGLGAVAMASVVSVSSSTVTTIVSGNSGRKHLVLFNDSTGLLYVSPTTSSATVNAGMIVLSSTTYRLDDFNGTLYGLAPAGSSNINVRYQSISR